METKTENNNPIPSPLDQAYKKYKDDLSLRITGKKTDDLTRGIMDGSVSREGIVDLKSKIVSPEKFRTFHPKETLIGREIKEEYTSSSVVYEHPVEISGIQALANGTIVFFDKGDNLFELAQYSNDKYGKALVHHCESHILGFQFLADGRIIYLGGGYGSDDVKDLYQLVDRGYNSPFVVQDNYEETPLVANFDGGITTFQYVGGEKMYVGTENGNVHALTFRDDGGYDDKLVIDHSDPFSGLRPSETVANLLVLPDSKIVFKCGWSDRTVFANIKDDILVGTQTYFLAKKPEMIFNQGILFSSGVLSAIGFDDFKTRSVWDHRDDNFGAVDVMPDKNIVVADKNLVKILK